MRLATVLHQDRQHLANVDSDGFVLPALAGRPPENSDSLAALIEAGADALGSLREFAATPPPSCRIAGDAVTLLAPLPRPRNNVICLGWNYSEHIAEAGDKAPELPQHPVVFTKAISSVIGPYADIPYDAEFSTQVDWEVELGVVIGTPGRRIAAARAGAHIFGFTVINDISARDVQFRHQQFFLGKSMDGGCPMGPWIVTADEIPDPQALDLSCAVNGEVKQSSNTRFQIFDIPTTIEILSKGMTLQAGDVIATGTPSGVGFARKPPQFLKPGDVVECTIEGLGTIRNTVRA